jgi:hypothetical protein
VTSVVNGFGVLATNSRTKVPPNMIEKGIGKMRRLSRSSGV